MNKPTKPPENLGSVPINGGVGKGGKHFGGARINGKFVPNVVGKLRREVDPNGQIVEHRVRNSAYVHDRMHSAGKLAPELHTAAEKFRMDFERAQLFGSYARSDLFRTRAGKGEITDKFAAAK